MVVLFLLIDWSPTEVNRWLWNAQTRWGCCFLLGSGAKGKRQNSHSWCAGYFAEKYGSNSFLLKSLHYSSRQIQGREGETQSRRASRKVTAVLPAGRLCCGEVLVYTLNFPFIYSLLLRNRRKGVAFITLFTVEILSFIKNESFTFANPNTHAG